MFSGARARRAAAETVKHLAMLLVCLVALLPTLDNYRQVPARPGFLRSMFDSLAVAGGSSLIGLALGTPCGYALARLRFRGANAFGFIMLVTRMISPIVIIIPLTRVFQILGLVDTRLGLILAPTWMNIGLVVWMMRGYFIDIPDSLEEAARLDGCSVYGAFARVALPVVLPGLAATTIFCFLFSWNELMMALTLASLRVRTTPVFVISEFVGYLAVEWGVMSAAGMLVVLPMLVFVVSIQRNLVRGLTMGAVK